MCRQEVATINHLFLILQVTSQLWNLFINLKGIIRAMLGRTTKLLSCWNEGGKITTNKPDGGSS